jgi:hypothetical protein
VELLLSILGTLAAILGWLLIVALGLVLVLLLVPFHARASGRVRLQGDQDDVLDGRFRLAWGAGFLSLNGSPAHGILVRVLGIRLARLGPGAGPKAQEKRATRKKKRPDRPGRGAGWFWRHRQVLLGAGMRILRTLHLRGELRGAIGLEDPADMAIVHGLLDLAARAGLGVAVECDYLEPRLDLAGELGLRFWPAETLVVAVGQWLRPELRAALKDKA